MSKPTPPELDSTAKETTVVGGRSLWHTEDFWAVWLGLSLLIIGLAVYLPGAPDDLAEQKAGVQISLQLNNESDAPHHNVDWYLARDAMVSLKGTSVPQAQTLQRWVAPPATWDINPIDALWMGEERAKNLVSIHQPIYDAEHGLTREMHGRAVVAQATAEGAGFEDPALNLVAAEAIRAWRDQLTAERRERELSRQQPYHRFGYLLALGVALALVLFPIVETVHGSGKKFLVSFLALFSLAVISQILAARGGIENGGLTWPFWALFTGFFARLLLPNQFGLAAAKQLSFYLKVAMVLMAAQVMIPAVINLPAEVLITMIMLIIVLIILWSFLKPLMPTDSNSLKGLLATEVGVGGFTTLFSVTASGLFRTSEVTIILLLTLLWTWLASWFLPGLLNYLDLDSVSAGMVFGALLDPAHAAEAALALPGDDPSLAADQFASAKLSLIVFLGIAAAIARGRPSQSRADNHQPWVLAGGMLIAMGLTSLTMAFQGIAWSEVMLDRGLLQGFVTPIRDWFFTLAIVSLALILPISQLKATGFGSSITSIYLGGQVVKLLLLLTVVWIIQ